MGTSPYHYGPICRAQAARLPAVPDPDRRTAARRLLALGAATLAAVAARWWGGDLDAAKAALYPPLPTKEPPMTERDAAAAACRDAFLGWWGDLRPGQALEVRVAPQPEAGYRWDDAWRCEFFVTEPEGGGGWFGWEAARLSETGGQWACEQWDEGDSLLLPSDAWSLTIGEDDPQ